MDNGYKIQIIGLASKCNGPVLLQAAALLLLPIYRCEFFRGQAVSVAKRPFCTTGCSFNSIK